LGHPTFRLYFATALVAMMADNVEHVLSYWVLFETFHSPALMGFAVITHWAPFLLFSLYFGMLADRYDCRRLIQVSQVLYAAVSVAWAVLIFTNTLAMWHAMVLLVLHGMAGVVWAPAGQLIVHDMVGADHLPSAVRLNATARSVAILLGPAVGGILLLTAGPALGLAINAGLYLILAGWLFSVPYSGHSRASGRQPPARLGLGAARGALHALASQRALIAMLVVVAGSAVLVGNAFQAQMPEFAQDLGTDHAGIAYSALLAADAVGGLVGGVLLESSGLLPTGPRTAIVLAALWAATLVGFAASTSYPLALACLFLSGICYLAFNSMAQALVQLEAPSALRGRAVGLLNMVQQGLRVESGVSVGVLGSVVGVHWSLGLSAALLLLLSLATLGWYARPGLLRLTLRSRGPSRASPLGPMALARASCLEPSSEADNVPGRPVLLGERGSKNG
jgi:MFS family permease